MNNLCVLENDYGENNCYVNAVIQFLYHCDQFVQEFCFSSRYENQQNQCHNSECLVCELRRLLISMTNMNSTKVTYLHDIGDSSELFSDILSEIHHHDRQYCMNREELNRVPCCCVAHRYFDPLILSTNRNLFINNEETHLFSISLNIHDFMPYVLAIQEYLNNLVLMDYSPFEQLIHLYINKRHIKMCSKCHHLLKSPICDNCHQNNSFFCSCISRNITCGSLFQIYELPLYLTISFMHDRSGLPNDVLSSFVSLLSPFLLPSQLTHVQEHVVYQLFSIICFVKGHYIVYILNTQQNYWILYDDTKTYGYSCFEDMILNIVKYSHMPVLITYKKNPDLSLASIGSYLFCMNPSQLLKDIYNNKYSLNDYDKEGLRRYISLDINVNSNEIINKENNNNENNGVNNENKRVNNENKRDNIESNNNSIENNGDNKENNKENNNNNNNEYISSKNTTNMDLDINIDINRDIDIDNKNDNSLTNISMKHERDSSIEIINEKHNICNKISSLSIPNSSNNHEYDSCMNQASSNGNLSVYSSDNKQSETSPSTSISSYPLLSPNTRSYCPFPHPPLPYNCQIEDLHHRNISNNQYTTQSNAFITPSQTYVSYSMSHNDENNQNNNENNQNNYDNNQNNYDNNQNNNDNNQNNNDNNQNNNYNNQNNNDNNQNNNDNNQNNNYNNQHFYDNNNQNIQSANKVTQNSIQSKLDDNYIQHSFEDLINSPLSYYKK
ncbi:hypothetical protein WA158_000418 [Blastocystis sp. Blastoise]